jgi:tRNA pseudouridine55 synthase
LKLPAAGFVLPVDKPVGPTSHDVVGRARRALGERRIGHTGTLDPFASGLLLLCVGPATRLAEYITGLDKEYVATARLGEVTTTDDLRGEVVRSTSGWEGIAEADVVAALAPFVGEIDQVPPQFSAKKVDGEAMHRRARRGEHVDLPPSRVTVFSVDVEEIRPPNVSFRVHCSSGTYIRALARDLGEALGTGAHLTELRRTRVGRFEVDGALGLDELENLSAVERVLMRPLEALAHLPSWVVDPEGVRRISHGQSVPYAGPEVSGPVAVSSGPDLVAVGHVVDGALKPSKVFA